MAGVTFILKLLGIVPNIQTHITTGMHRDSRASIYTKINEIRGRLEAVCAHIARTTWQCTYLDPVSLPPTLTASRHVLLYKQFCQLDVKIDTTNRHHFDASF